MCGIFFSIGFENLPSQVIDSVVHRGPDGRGWNEFKSSHQGSVVLAHRRLAIVDLSEDGHQPMSSEDGRYWVTYNGEIYNYLEIREELKSLGYFFKTQTDTEVLLKSYIHWGQECLDKFNGMFAFVIWDNAQKEAFAARDRFGVKPLYYYKEGNKIAFASEIKQFKHIPGWYFTLNEEMADFYKVHGYCDHAHETLYKNVFQILPGHLAHICAPDYETKITQWYSLKDNIKTSHLSDGEACQQFGELFFDSIKLRLRSDVTIGTCLSGGVDSSSIVSTMRAIEPAREIKTFSSVFPGHKVDESSYIDQLSLHKNLISHKNLPNYEHFLEQLDLILYHQDLPFVGTSIFAQWMTFQDAQSKQVTVLLDGQGADESLLGYPGMLNVIIFDYMNNLEIKNLWRFLKWQNDINAQNTKTTVLLAMQQRLPKIYKKILRIKNQKNSQYQPALKSINDVCLWYFSNNLQSLLRYEDRNSMAFSIESRLPFLDYRLVEFIFSLSINQKFRNNQTKWVLRKSMKNINIDEILDRKDKIGFATPESEWIKNSSSKNHSQSFKEFIFKRWLDNEKI